MSISGLCVLCCQLRPNLRLCLAWQSECWVQLGIVLFSSQIFIYAFLTAEITQKKKRNRSTMTLLSFLCPQMIKMVIFNSFQMQQRGECGCAALDTHIHTSIKKDLKGKIRKEAGKFYTLATWILLHTPNHTIMPWFASPREKRGNHVAYS